MIHKHLFFSTQQVFKTKLNQASMHRGEEGVTIVCGDPECTEIRNVWSDGVVEVIKEGLPDKE